MKAYLVLITWPNGVEGLLFPRPGNVAVASTIEEGKKDFEIAVRHMKEFAKDNPGKVKGAMINLVEFHRGPTYKFYEQ